MSRKSRRRNRELMQQNGHVNIPAVEKAHLRNVDELIGKPRDEASKIAISQRQSIEQFSGPVPPPAILREYEQIVPGAAKQILDQAEKQTDHRIEIEKQVIRSDIRRSWSGLWIAGIISILSISGGILLVLNGHDVAGATIATASVATLAGVFVYGTKQRQQERVEKAKIMAGRS
jgi:uncharacterized membrane protein